MCSRYAGVHRRSSAVLAAFALLGVTFAAPVLAGGGDDHTHGPAAAPIATSATPRVIAQSESYELVGLLRGDRLAIYVDRLASNEPVTDAKLTVTLGGEEEVEAENRPDGTYAVSSNKFAGAGPLELVFAVEAPGGDDLLIGTLDLPGTAHAGALAACASS